MRFNIIGRDNGVGLSRDKQILTEILVAEGHQVTFSDFAQKDKLDNFDVNIFTELVNSAWLSKARINWLIPNPEWYDIRWRQHISKFTVVLCKTRASVIAFRSLSRRTRLISFTSLDQWMPEIQKNNRKWLHIAGRSGQKGTETVFSTWENNPHFPHLTILQDGGKKKDRKQLDNLTFEYNYITDESLKLLQNECGVHVCPSETEGFGHYLMEAMSCKATIITTNAPPMNELVTSDRGILTEYERKNRQRLAINYFVSEKTLADAVEKTLRLSDAEINSMRDKGRDFYISNDAFFREAFKETLRGCDRYAQCSNITRPQTRRFSPSHPRLPEERR